MNRSDETLFDPRISDWLAHDPYAAPDQALDVVVAAFPSIKQRRASRAPRRFSSMHFALRAGAVVAVVAVAALGGIYILGPIGQPGGPAASATPQPESSPNPSLATGTAGRLILTSERCAWSAHYDRMFPGTYTVEVANETESLAVFDLNRLVPGRTFDEAVILTTQVQEAIRTGAEWPAEFFELATQVADSSLRLEGHQHVTLTLMAAETGTYGIVCSENERSSEEVIAVYLTGPLEIIAPVRPSQ
jgi:hypothetical protein